MLNNIQFKVQTKVIPTKGLLVYEYNPFRNYRCVQSMFEYKGEYYTLDQLKSEFNIIPDNTDNPQYWLKNGVKDESLSNDITLYEKGQLIDFITDELKFDLEHPVNITPQYSYDGSVNLILNDGINLPRLINSRFSAAGKNTYEVVDRKGNNDTNIYDLGEQFDIDTSLYKRVISIPKLTFSGITSGGNLRVGNYHFYIKLSDADGNETDYVAESGLISVFIGFGSPSSLTTGTKNENSYKGVTLYMSNIDSSYDYLYVYYSRYTAENLENLNIEYKKIDKKFVVTNAGTCNISITGFESTIDITALDINLLYNIVDAAKTLAVCQNMLMLGNVHKPDIPYKDLSDLALRFCPYLKDKTYDCQINLEYTINTSTLGYFDPEYIYNYTGYWDKEYYRLGVVFILPNGELTPVFNIRGCSNMLEYSDTFKYTKIDVYTTKDSETVRLYIDYNETNYLLNNPNSVGVADENVKGVIKFNSNKDTNIVHGLDIRIDPEAISELKKYVSGMFFVRQSRIPTILAQGITLGIDLNSFTPTVPTAGGLLDLLKNSLDKTYVTTEDINDVNYITEGFLSRYSFKFKKKSSSLWSKIGKVMAVTAGVVAVAAASVFTAGAVGAAVGGMALAGSVTAGAGAVVSVAGAIGAGVGATLGVSSAVGGAVVAGSAIVTAGVITTTVASILEVKYGISTFYKKTLNGRDTKCPKGYKIVETDDSRKLTLSYIDRLIIKDSSKNKILAIVCPDYEVNPAYYNLIFTGNDHLIETTKSLGNNILIGHTSNYFSLDIQNNERHYYIPDYYDSETATSGTYKVISVPSDVKCVGLDNLKFRSRAGYAEEAFRYECVGDDYKSDYTKKNSDEDEETISNKKINSDIVRGIFGSYLGVNNTGTKLAPATTVNIYIPKYNPSNTSKYMQIRMDDNSTYSAITDRISIKDFDDYLVTPKSRLLSDTTDYYASGYAFSAFRGDCYICLFTHRVIRNFNDPSAPYNDDIVDENTWKDNYNPEKAEDYEKINLGDVNAVLLGMWVTFRVRSSYNLNIRTLDSSNVDEVLMTGHPRGYYPYLSMSVEGTYKTQESQIYNKGFSKSLSERWNNLLPDVPYIKNWFGTRIMYSDIHINDAYKNGYRVFQGTHYRDYTREYGEITKLVSLDSSLLVVFEHGIGLLEVNQQILTLQNGAYVNTSNVLPEKPKIISDMFGSQWADSVIKTPKGIYGVDTVAKKIWKTDGTSIKCISDFAVLEFLNNNISLRERELTPKLGIRNVKTFYNSYKLDVMFTFYDNTYGFEEKVWNLCYNELLDKFITFYSWVPSFMENIDNIPFSFNRDVSKWIAKLGISHARNSFANGITVTNNVLNNLSSESATNNFKCNIRYYTKQGEWKDLKEIVESDYPESFIGVLDLENTVLPSPTLNYKIKYTLKRDNYGNYKKFLVSDLTCKINYPEDALYAGQTPYKQCLLFSTSLENFEEVYELINGELVNIYTLDKNPVYIYINNGPESLLSELYYRNIKGHTYADWDDNKVRLISIDINGVNKVALIEDNNGSKSEIPLSLYLLLPIFKNRNGKRPMLPRNQLINPDKIVTLLNISADILYPEDIPSNVSDAYFNNSNANLGTYESTIAIIPKWNMLFLSTDFWKHGLAGIIDIADDIYPCYWYGKQHPFEFEFIVVNDPSVHKIFTNLELIANKAKPESFHYEVIGEAYDFAKDKPNMYFRQEALKALWLYNGADISYNRDFLKLSLKLLAKSADLPHLYYARLDTINEIEDSYVEALTPKGSDYRHLSGAEIVYYPNRLEFRVWQHVRAVDVDDLLDTSKTSFGGRGLMASNMRYLEDRWKVSINPILICYKNEYLLLPGSNTALCVPKNSTWVSSYDKSTKLPPLNIFNSPIPSVILQKGQIDMPNEATGEGLDNALYQLYDKDSNYLDTTKWLDDVDIYRYNFGIAQNRKEVDLRDKFIKIRIRYSGEDLAIIDFVNTIYQISYA